MRELVGRVAGRVAVRPPVVREPDLVQSAALHGNGRHPLGDHHAGLDRAAGGDDRRPAHVRQAALGRQLGGDLAEEGGLQLGQVGQEPRHPAGRVVLGQPVGGRGVREHVRARLVAAGLEPVLRVGDDLPGRVALLPVERVAER